MSRETMSAETTVPASVTITVEVMQPTPVTVEVTLPAAHFIGITRRHVAVHTYVETGEYRLRSRVSTTSPSARMASRR